ncbi:tetratricopeptide repeat protein [Telmatocola sphagniphila]|uniref:Tetratricopeptide repeat protein n=1 Tax=Telmatocola sphagniphila TaxID=1123043 RepID=A0A8E6EVQ4_9BACT|nr:tetratricopeptide repeat protein [Telmatocola sphagniphila]QVL33070.1 tetratricopeptide repeat protein [Telmatocola sphagniphila]
MADITSKTSITPTPEQRRIAADNFDRANQILPSGNYDYGIQLLQLCCKLDPGNLAYRQMLRRTQKSKYSNLKGSSLAFMTTAGTRTRMKNCLRSGDYLKVLEYGEEILSKNPWDLGVQQDMATAAESAGLLDTAIFVLDQARQKFPKDPGLNRQLARLFEKRGHFQHAIALWQMVKEAVPSDVEAAHKAKDLAASETIQRGRYGEGGGSNTHTAIGSGTGSNSDSKEQPALDRAAREAAPFLKKIQEKPEDVHAWLQLAGVYKKMNRVEQAKETLEKALNATGQNFQVRMELLEMEIDPLTKNLSLSNAKIAELEAQSAEEAVEEVDGPSLEDLKRIRNKLIKEINAREVEIFRAKSERFPTDASFRLELAIRLYQGGKVDEAIAELQVVRKDTRLSGKAMMHLGKCFLLKNNWRLAQRNLEESLAAVTVNDEASKKELLFLLAKGHAEFGELTKAIELGHDLENIDFVYKGIDKLVEAWETRLQEA